MIDRKYNLYENINIQFYVCAFARYVLTEISFPSSRQRENSNIIARDIGDNIVLRALDS